MFIEYRQNNSGGRFIFDKKKGIGVYVIVEAANADEADDIAENIGLYWNGVEEGRDCECCGDRWSNYHNEAADVPSHYGVPLLVKDGKWYLRQYGGIGWAKEGTPEGYIHFLDSKIEPIWLMEVSEEEMRALWDAEKKGRKR